GGQGPGGVPGVVAGGGCDVGVASHFHDPDGEVAQGGHDLGTVSGADLGGVLAVGDVADVVQGLDAPMSADPPGEVGGAGLGDGQAGDPIGGDGPPAADGEGGRTRRVMAMAWAACGNTRPTATVAVLIVRDSSRPCPRWRWRSAAGMARQGRFLIWAYRPG